MNDQEKILEAAARFAQNNNGGQQPPPVQPQPVPMSFQLSHVKSVEGKSFVVMSVFTPQGQTVLFFDPDGATKIGEGLIDTARTARTGLEIPKLH